MRRQEQKKKKSNLLEVALEAGYSLIFKALIGLQITGDIKSKATIPQIRRILNIHQSL